jgi:hypothetical protein
VVVALVAPRLAAQPRALDDAEVIYYDWKLEGAVGALAGLFLPRTGEGSLTTREAGDGRLESVLLITSPKSKRGEFWTYGAELRRDGSPLRTWSSYLWRGESKYKETELAEQDVVDIASGIYHIRKHLPREPQRMRIWSDGKLYPVVVRPGGEETRRLPGGAVRTRRYTIAGVRVAGERFWEGHLDLWLTLDQEATPVEILVARKWARVRLERDPDSPGANR